MLRFVHLRSTISVKTSVVVTSCEYCDVLLVLCADSFATLQTLLAISKKIGYWQFFASVGNYFRSSIIVIIIIIIIIIVSFNET